MNEDDIAEVTEMLSNVDEFEVAAVMAAIIVELWAWDLIQGFVRAKVWNYNLQSVMMVCWKATDHGFQRDLNSFPSLRIAKFVF